MSKILQFKITLIESEPPIWRTFQVTDDYRLDRFHQVIQIAMGWTNSHLHEFYFTDRRFGMLSGEEYDDAYGDTPALEDETIIFLKDLVLKAGDSLRYNYDFGDGWEHLLHVEEISTGDLLDPLCLKGDRSCPPEDCGGIGGYTDILNTLKGATGFEYEELNEWLPEDFDAAHFSINKVNKELKKFGTWHRKYPKKKSTPWHQID